MLSRLERLEATRDKLEAAIAGCESLRDLAALSREYRAVLAELDSLNVGQGASAADEIAERRRQRQTGADRKARTSN